MIGTLCLIEQKWTVKYNKSGLTGEVVYEYLPLYPGPFPLPEGVFIDDVLIEGNEVHFEITENDEQDKYSNGEWARSYSTVKYAKLRFDHLAQEYNFLPGFIDQFDDAGELNPNDRTISDFLAWLSINNFKIIKK